MSDNPDNYNANFDQEQEDLCDYLLQADALKTKLDTSKEVSEKFINDLETYVNRALKKDWDDC